jgi:hypothetical protein
MKLWRFHKIECFILKYRVPPLWPTYIDERRTTFVYGIKVSCYGEHVGEHIGNLRNILEPDEMRTHWEHIGNQGKMKGKKKQGTLSACLGLPIGCMKFLLPKELVNILALAKNTLSIKPQKCNLDLNS